MLASIHFLENRQRLLVIGNRFLVLPQSIPGQAEVVQTGGNVRMPLPRRLPVNRQRLLVIGNRFLVFPQIMPGPAEVVQVSGNVRMPLPIHLPVNRQRLLVIGNRGAGVAHIPVTQPQIVEQRRYCPIPVLYRRGNNVRIKPLRRLPLNLDRFLIQEHVL